MKLKLSRRDFLKIIRDYAIAFFGAGVVSYVYGFWGEPEWIEISRINISLKNLPTSFNGFRIAQISDIHIGGWMNRDRLSRVVEILDSLEPDLIVITGDHVFGLGWSTELDAVSLDYIEAMTELARNYTILAVLGNHDHWTDALKISKMLNDSGIVELKNDIFSIKRDGQEFYIAGVDDVWEKKDRLDVVLEKLPKESASILLAHEPDYADEVAKTGRFGLQFSGHSHGGQVVIPFYGAPNLPYLGQKYYSGLYQVGDMWLYTNRGVGMIEPAVRFNCRPEITVFTLISPT